MTSTGMLQWTGRIAAVAIIGAFMFASTQVLAQEEGKKISFEGSLDIVSPYYFRGNKQEDSGLILQPDAAVTFGRITDDMGQVGNTWLTVGLWNSIHSKKTGQANSNDIWYEADFYAIAGATIAENYTGSVEYVAYTSPNGAFDSVSEIGFRFAYDDSEQLGDYSVNPYILWVFELSGTNSPGGIDNRHQYVEVGAGKTFVIVASETQPVKLNVPLTFGLSFDGYYLDANDSTRQLGFVDIGAIFSTPLPDTGYGAWEAYAGVNVLWLNGHYVKENNGGEFGIAGTVGASLAF